MFWCALLSKRKEFSFMSNGTKELLTVESMCEKLKVSRNTAYHLLAKQKVRGFKVGRSWRIPVGSVEEFIADQINEEEEKNNEGERNGGE